MRICWVGLKTQKIQLRFIDTIRFMTSSLDSLARNLVGVNGMMCNQCRREMEPTHVDENYFAHGICGKCRGASNNNLTTDPIFANLKVGHTDEQFPLLLRKGVYPYKYMDHWSKFEDNHLPQSKHSTGNSTCQELVSATTTTPREFGEFGYDLTGRLSPSLPEDGCAAVE